MKSLILWFLSVAKQLFLYLLCGNDVIFMYSLFNWRSRVLKYNYMDIEAS